MTGSSHTPDWIEASQMLREAMELYRSQYRKSSLAKVVDDVIAYIETQSGKWLDEKTIRRDIGNKDDGRKLYRIPDWRIKIYVKWLYEEVGKDHDWITKWLNYTTYSSPGVLLAEIGATSGNIHKVYQEVKTNVPPLKKRLWGRFLGRQKEITRLIQWADHQRYPIAILHGFGGNGKSTLQQKVGEDFVHGVTCSLRWPYDGAVWVSAIDYPRGQPSLSDTLREIARTFELYEDSGHYPQTHLEAIPPEILQKDVQKLLEKHRVLILLDNFETVSKPNQAEILKFLDSLRGASQTLISTRYRPDWFLEKEQDEIYPMAHVLIPVDGLSSGETKQLVQEFLQAKSLSPSEFDVKEITRLTAATRNNPKTILTVLGLVEQGISLKNLLDAVTSGTPEADRIYDIVIDRAWEEILTKHDKAVLMAKALFNHSVNDNDLGQVAGIDEKCLREAIKKLAAISFFEFDRTPQHTLRISTHPLAQDFARRVLRDHPEFEQEAEARWWQEYGPSVVRQIRETAYQSLYPGLEDDVANVLVHIEHHITQRSSYCLQAAKLFADRRKGKRLGLALRHWGRYDDVLRLAKLILDFGIEQKDAELISECALVLIGVIAIERHNFDEADKYLGLAIEQNTRLKDQWLGAMIDFIRAYLYLERGYFGAAEQFSQNALQGFLEVGNPLDIAGICIDLAGFTIDIAAKDLEAAIITSDETLTKLASAEAYLNQAKEHLDTENTDCQETQRMMVIHRAQRAEIARLRGELDQARDFIQSCLSESQSLFLNVALYGELALIEHLTGNKDLAYSYEEKGLSLFRQIGMREYLLAAHWHCYRVIDRMKREGMW